MALTPTRRDEFDEDTGYERSVLDSLFEAKAQTEGREIEGAYVDLRGPSTVIADAGVVRLGAADAPRTLPSADPFVAGCAAGAGQHVGPTRSASR